MKRMCFAALLTLAVTSPAFAAEYYVGKDKATNKCKVVETKPDGQTMVMVGEASYSTKEDAKAAKKKAAECDKPKEAKDKNQETKTETSPETSTEPKPQ